MPEDRYTHGHHDAVLRSHRSRTAENSAAYLLPHLRPGMRVLDVGCGPGTISADLAAIVAGGGCERGDAASGAVVAMDRAEDVLAEAASLFEARGLTNVTVDVADVYAMAYDDASFDVVHAHQVLQHLSDPVAALGEMRRVTRPGGLVAVRDADYGAMTWAPADPRLDRWQTIYQAVARANDAEPNAGRHLLRWANEIGFASVVPSASVWCFADDETREWWGGLWADRMIGSAVADQAKADGVATAEQLDEIAAAFRRWSTDQDGWFAVLHGEILATR